MTVEYAFDRNASMVNKNYIVLLLHCLKEPCANAFGRSVLFFLFHPKLSVHVVMYSKNDWLK